MKILGRTDESSEEKGFVSAIKGITRHRKLVRLLWRLL